MAAKLAAGYNEPRRPPGRAFGGLREGARRRRFLAHDQGDDHAAIALIEASLWCAQEIGATGAAALAAAHACTVRIGFDPRAALSAGEQAVTFAREEEDDYALAIAPAHRPTRFSRTDRSGRDWKVGHRGTRYLLRIPAEPEAQRAARDLSNTTLLKYSPVPSAWVRKVEPLLALSWARAAGFFNARVELTPEELLRLPEDLEHSSSRSSIDPRVSVRLAQLGRESLLTSCRTPTEPDQPPPLLSSRLAEPATAV